MNLKCELKQCKYYSKGICTNGIMKCKYVFYDSMELINILPCKEYEPDEKVFDEARI